MTPPRARLIVDICKRSIEISSSIGIRRVESVNALGIRFVLRVFLSRQLLKYRKYPNAYQGVPSCEIFCTALMRAGVIGVPTPYQIFGEFAGLPFWGGGLTLLAAAPGVGKTSWMLRMLFDATTQNIPAAIGCYEHTEEELKYRISQQASAMLAGPHGEAEQFAKEDKLAECGNVVLLSLDDRRDTVRGLEDVLLNTYNFPKKGNALLTVDYLIVCRSLG